jgi:MFS family permease
VIIGSLLLRLASHATGQMFQLYLGDINAIHYSLSRETRGLITASFFVSELLGALAFGALSDRYGRRFFILLGPILGAIGVQLTSLTVVLWLLVITRLFEGLSTASSVPSTLSYISEATVGRPYLRARVVGLFELTLVGGIALGSVVSGYLWQYFGQAKTVAGIELTSPAFTLNALIYVASLAVFAWGLRDIRRRPKTVKAVNGLSRFAHYRLVLKSPSVWKFAPAWISVFSLIGMWTNVSTDLFTGREHFRGQLLTGSISPVAFGNGQAALATFFAAGIFGWSLVLGRYKKTSVMLLGAFALFALFLTVFSINHLQSFDSPLYYVLLGLLLIAVLVLSGFTPAALTYLADTTERFTQDRGSIMGLYSVFLGIGQLLGTAVGGYMAEWNGIDGLLFGSAIFTGIAGLSLLAIRRSEPQPASAAAPVPQEAPQDAVLKRE